MMSSAGIPLCERLQVLDRRQRTEFTVSFVDLAQDGINGVSGIGQFHLYRDDRERLQRGKIRTQVDGVFLGGDEASSLAAVLQVEQLADIFLGIRVMIAIEGFGYWFDIGGPQLQNKILRTGDPAKHDRTRRNGSVE